MDITIITRFLNGLLLVLIPIGLGIYLTRRFKMGWRLWWIGAAAFVLSQIGHIPFNFLLDQILKTGVLPTPPQSWIILFTPIVLGLSAGLWEEITLYAVYRWWVKDARSWVKGVVIGAGRGGFESILLGLYVIFIFIQMAAFRFADLDSLLPAHQIPALEQQLAVYWSIPWYDTLLGVLERSFTIVFHISASLIVLQVFNRGQIRWLWFAVLWHALADAGAVYFALEVNQYSAEVWIGIVCVASLWIIFALKGSNPIHIDEEHPQKQVGQDQDLNEHIEINKEQVERTRYYTDIQE